MQSFIAPLLLLIVLFVAYGLLHRHQRPRGMCPGCTGCADRSQCTKDDKH